MLIKLLVIIASVVLGFFLVWRGRNPREYGFVLLLAWLTLRLLLVILPPSVLLDLTSVSLLGQLLGVIVARRVLGR